MIQYPEYEDIHLTPNYNLATARRHRNDPLVYEYCRQHTLITMREQDDWDIRQHKDPTIKMFGIFNKDKKQLGVCGFTSIDILNRSAEFSLYIGPEFQKCGYGEKALKTLLRHGFEDWNFHRIWGEVFVTNLRGLKLFKKIGFTSEGILRQTYWKRGKYINSHIISLLAGEVQL